MKPMPTQNIFPALRYGDLEGNAWSFGTYNPHDA